MPDLLLILTAYLLGCANVGYYLPWFAWRIDIRGRGSGNAGARNAGRLFGPAVFLTVLALDAGKGALAVYLALVAATGLAPLPALCALAAVAGHVWPVQLGGRGGKGLATALGSVAACLAWPAAGHWLLASFLPLLLYTHRDRFRRRRLAP